MLLAFSKETVLPVLNIAAGYIVVAVPEDSMKTKSVAMSNTWRATVLTLFPEMFPGALGISLIGKAREKNLWSLDVRDIREHGLGRSHRR